jgi:hypothetical protein
MMPIYSLDIDYLLYFNYLIISPHLSQISWAGVVFLKNGGVSVRQRSFSSFVCLSLSLSASNLLSFEISFLFANCIFCTVIKTSRFFVTAGTVR